LPNIGQKGYHEELYVDESRPISLEKMFKHEGSVSFPPGSMETAVNIGASQTTIPTTGANNKQDFPGILYLDHA